MDFRWQIRFDILLLGNRFAAIVTVCRISDLGITGIEGGKAASPYRELVRGDGLNYSGLEATGELTTQYGGVETILKTLMIDRSAKMVSRYEGFRSKETFESQIKKALVDC